MEAKTSKWAWKDFPITHRPGNIFLIPDYGVEVVWKIVGGRCVIITCADLHLGSFLLGKAVIDSCNPFKSGINMPSETGALCRLDVRYYIWAA